MKKIFGFPFAVFKEKVKSNPTCIPANFSFSSMSTNPSLSVVPSVISWLIFRKLLFTVGKRQWRQKFSSFAHLLRPDTSLGISVLVCFISGFSNVFCRIRSQITIFALKILMAMLSYFSLLWYCTAILLLATASHELGGRIIHILLRSTEV